MNRAAGHHRRPVLPVRVPGSSHLGGIAAVRVIQLRSFIQIPATLPRVISSNRPLEHGIASDSITRYRSLLDGWFLSWGRWITTIAATLRERTGTGNVDTDLAARLIASLTYGVLIDYLDTPADERAALRATLIDALPRFVTGGITALDAPDPPSPNDPLHTTERRP